MKLKPEIEVIAIKNPWRREDHYARTMQALSVIDITPSVIAKQPRTPERVNRRVGGLRLMAHQLDRAILTDARTERRALAAANEALEPMHRSWWARAVRAVRSLVGR